MAREQWHYSRNGQKSGPVAEAALRTLAAQGQLAPSDLVWREGMAAWMPAHRVSGLFPNALAAAIPPPLPRSGVEALWLRSSPSARFAAVAGLMLACCALTTALFFIFKKPSPAERAKELIEVMQAMDDAVRRDSEKRYSQVRGGAVRPDEGMPAGGLGAVPDVRSKDPDRWAESDRHNEELRENARRLQEELAPTIEADKQTAAKYFDKQTQDTTFGRLYDAFYEKTEAGGTVRVLVQYSGDATWPFGVYSRGPNRTDPGPYLGIQDAFHEKNRVPDYIEWAVLQMKERARLDRENPFYGSTQLNDDVIEDFRQKMMQAKDMAGVTEQIKQALSTSTGIRSR